MLTTAHHQHITDDLRETLALYVFQLLDAAERAAVDAHMAEGCSVCRLELSALRETAALIPQVLEDIKPHPRVKEKLLASIGANSTLLEPIPGIFVLPQSGDWKKTPFKGVWTKTLYVERETGFVTSLLRMDAGSSYPPHYHVGVEQCLVLEGSVRLGEIALRSGDFEYATAGTTHGMVQTDTGCLLMIIANQKDEILQEPGRSS
ncbi:MAG TPA: cupin domain-containing protein [Bryobacteraceae bacterium]|nr:cupin domain-containing protein [Bryobacteraceae bacterium]